MRWRLLGYGILLALFYYLFVLQIQAIWPLTIDDMYISLRYARHWAGGDGLLWNLNAPPVEGYSNFSFVALGALAILLKVNPVIALKLAGLLGLFFTCWFIYLISRFWFSSRESVLPPLGLLLYKGQIIWATSGLETAFYEALICAAVYFCLRALGYRLFPNARGAPQNRFFILASLCLSLAGLTRPEAPALMILFFILICCDKPVGDMKSYLQGLGLFCISLLLFYAPYFVWRLIYYGYLFPNSVYCKGFSKIMTFYLDLDYLKLVWPFALLAGYVGIKSQDKKLYFLCLPSVVYVLLLMDADPVVAFENRLFLPSFVLLFPLALLAISMLVYEFWRKRDSVYEFLVYIGSMVFVLFFIPMMSLADYRYFSQNPILGEQLRFKVLHWLSSHSAPGDTVVLADSGLIPYATDLTFIDSYCLNNLSMAHYQAETRYEQFCKDILIEQPEIIILTSLLEQGRILYTPSDVCLNTVLSGQNGYKLSTIMETKNPNSIYRYELYKKISRRSSKEW